MFSTGISFHVIQSCSDGCRTFPNASGRNQPIKIRWGVRWVRLVILVPDEPRCAADRGPHVGSRQICPGLECETAVVESRPEQHDVGPRAGNVQGRRANLECADVAAVAAAGVGDGRKVKWPRRAPLVRGEPQTLSFLNPPASLPQRPLPRW